MTSSAGEGSAGLTGGSQLKRKRPDDDEPDDRQHKEAKPAEVPDCPICFSPLGADAITLLGTCGHSLHSACLRSTVIAALSLEIGEDEAGKWFRAMPPRCPLCRRRFQAAHYWPELAYADQYDDAGYTYSVAHDPVDAQVDDGHESSEESSDGDEAQGYDSEGYDSDSDSGSGYVHAGVQCGLCNQNGAVEQRVDEFLDEIEIEAPACYICHGDIAEDDEGTHILVCQHCGAPSHFHD